MQADYSGWVVLVMLLIVAFKVFGSGCGGTCG